MHPILELSNLSQAPIAYRSIATAAVNSSSRAFVNLQILADRHRNTSLPPSHILPVVYETLNPVLIPDIHRLDSALPLPIVGRVIMVLETLNIMLREKQVPIEAFSDLWPRLFLWWDFMETYRLSHPDLRMYPRGRLLALFTDATYHFHVDNSTVELIQITRGLRTLLARAWSFFFESGNPFDHVGLIPICDLVNEDANADDPGNFDELLLGVEGGMADLAVLVVKHLNSVLDYPTAKEVYLPVYLSAPMGIIRQTTYNVEFLSVLLEQGLVVAITALIAKFASKPEANDILTSCFIALIPSIQAVPAYPWIEQALRAGILRAITAFRPPLDSDSGGRLSEHIGLFLWGGLSLTLVYFPVLIEVKRTLADVKLLAATAAFQASPVISQWRDFVAVADKHIACLNYHLSDYHTSFQICNNDECDVIAVKHTTRRCSACQLAHYCSASCQRFDWRQGNHRADCKRLASHRLSDPEHLSAHSRSLICSLVQGEYLLQRSSIHLGEIVTMQNNPGEPYCFLVDYCKGRADVSLDLVNKLLEPPVPAKFAAQLVHQLGRAVKSGGRTQLAVVRIPEGPIITARIIAIRHPDLTVHDTLAELARTIPVGLIDSDVDQVAPKVLPLLNRTTPVFSFASA
ncbi:hypothetical protein B0H11DRAFT_2293074 [Mycena galericulata]|nr:hypothetical protein B0H11DRAFT_2293074 [Mycena galericulata]